MSQTKNIAAIIVAAGSGTRAGGGVPKQYRAVGGVPLLRHALRALSEHPSITSTVAIISPEHNVYYADAAHGLKLLPPVMGGEVRQDSVHKGLAALASLKPDYVLIHDGARPFLSATMIDALISKLSPDTGVLPALPVADTVRRLAEDGSWKLVKRAGLMRMQTPQCFPYAAIAELHDKHPGGATDDASLWLDAGRKLEYVEGEERLRKVTTAADILWAESNAAHRTAVGMGYDVHRLIAGKSIRLGGIDIPHDKKLEGHSDADVVLHAVVDAVLGALGEGDIGAHFPPSDAKLKGADSKIFVTKAAELVKARGGNISHIDVTLICEAPKVSPHRHAMREALASMLQLDVSQVSIKATTSEKLGFTGRGEGIAAQAVATLTLPTRT